MKLRKGKAEYALPPYHQIVSVTVNADGVEWPIIVRHPFKQLPFAGPGRPEVCLITGHTIKFEPTPDKHYTASIIYCPPLEKI